MHKVLSLESSAVHRRPDCRLARFLLLSSTALTAATLALTLSTTGAGAQSVTAGAGTTITLPNETYPGAVNSVAANGAGAKIIGNGVDISRSGSSDGNTRGASATNGGSVDLTGGSIAVTSTGTGNAVYTGSNGTVTLDGVDVSLVTAGRARALEITSGSVTATDTTISVTGHSNNSGEAGAGIRTLSPGTSAQLTDSQIIASGNYTYGLLAVTGSSITASGSSISTNGSTAIGVYSNAANEGGSTVTLTDLTVDTVGSGAYGLYAARQSNTTANTFAVLTATEVDVATNGLGAHGAYADRGSNLTLNGGSILTQGDLSHGLIAQAMTDTTNGPVAAPASLSADGVVVTTQGADSYGAAAVLGGSLTIANSTITSEEAGGLAVWNGGSISLTDTTVVSAGPSVTAFFDQAGKTASLTFGEGAVLTENDGTLLDVQREGAGGDGVVSLLLKDGAVAEGDILDLDEKTTGRTNVTVQSGASLTGSLQGVGRVRAEGGSIAADDVSISFAASAGNVVSTGSAALPGGSIEITGGTITGSVANTNLAQEIQTVGALHGGTVTLSGVLIETTGSNVVTGPPYSISTGVDANYGGTAILEDVAIHSQGYRTHGIIANINGGTVTATNTTVVVDGSTSTGVQSYEANSSITLNGGSVTANGGSSVGLAAQRGGFLQSSADVLINGQLSVGAAADRGGTMVLSDASITTTAYGSVGLWADGDGSSISGDALAVQTQIRTGHGAVASNGGAIDLTGGSIAVAAGTANAEDYPPGFTYGLYAVGPGSSITTNGTAISTAEIWSFAVYATDGAAIDVAGGSITTTGERGYGLLAEDGSSVTSSASIVTSGFEAHGAQAYKNTDDDLGGEITLTGGSISTSGDRAYGLFATKAGSKITSGVDVGTSGEASHGAAADRGGVIELLGSQIETSGFGAVGLFATDSGSRIEGTAEVLTTGTTSAGAVALDGAKIDLAGGSVTTQGLQADGLVAVGSGSGMTADGVIVTTTGDGSQGAVAANGGSLDFANGSILAGGADAAGLFVSSGGATLTNALVSSAQSAGIAIVNSGSVMLTDSEIVSAGPSIAVDFFAEAGNVAVTLGSGTVATDNDGTLLQVARDADGGAGLVSLVLKDGAVAEGDVLDLDAKTSGSTSVTLQSGASLTGSLQGVRTLVAEGAGTTLNADNLDIASVGGSITVTAFIRNGAAATLTSGSISGAVADPSLDQVIRTLYVSGAGTELAASDLTITVSGKETTASNNISYALYVADGATVSLSDVTIGAEGFRSYGMTVDGSSVAADNLTVETHGNSSHAVQAFNQGPASGGDSLITLNGGSVTTHGVNSYGVYAQNAGSKLTSNADVTTYGDVGFGAYAYNGGEVSLTGGLIETFGQDAPGAKVERDGILKVSNTQIVAHNSDGMHLVNGADVAIANSSLAASGASLVAAFTEGGKVIEVTVGEGAVITQNNGMLLQVVRGEAGGDGVVTLVLAQGSTTAGNIVDLDPKTDGGTDVILEAGASWSGVMQGVRNFVTDPGGGEEPTEVTFDDFAQIGGNLAGNNTTYSFSSQGGSIGGNVVLQNGSKVTGGSVDSPVVIQGDVGVDGNSELGGNLDIEGDLEIGGTLNPGNSPGVINIAGSYNALPGANALFEADLTAANPVAGVDYDQVNIGGNVTGATTTIFLAPWPPGTPNDAPLGDLSQIQLVTVGGTVVDGAFVQGNRVVQYGHDVLLQGRQEGGTYVLGLTSIVADESYVLASVPALATRAGTVFLGTYSDRRGLDWSGESAAWARVVGGGFSLDKDAGVGLDATLVGTQVGVDLLGLPFHGPDHGQTRIGLTLGYGYMSADVDRGDGGGKAGSLDGSQVAVGAYVTHAQPDGLFADLLLQYRFLDFDLRAPQTGDMSVDGNSFDVAAEVGWQFPLGDGITLVPSAQLVYQHLTLDGYRDANFDASYDSLDALWGRLNLLAQGDFQNLRPFGLVGVSTDFLGDQETTISGYKIGTDSGQARAHLGAGLEATVADNFSLYLAGEYDISFDGQEQVYVGKLGGRLQF